MISTEDYTKWCDAMANIEHMQSQINEEKEKNFKWLGGELRSIFEELGTVVTVHFFNDGRAIHIVFDGQIVDLNPEVLCKVPIPMKIILDGIDLVIRLKPEF